MKISGVCLFFFLSILFFGCIQQRNSGTTETDEPQKTDSFFLKLAMPNPLIVPAVSIGNIKVDQRAEELTFLGTPQEGDAGMCKSFESWLYGSENRLSIFSECEGSDSMRKHVQWIRTNDARFQTKDGIGIGSTFDELQSLYSPLEKTAVYLSEDSIKTAIFSAVGQGISFEVQEKDPKECVGILVHKKDRKMPSMYFPIFKDLELLP